MKKYIIEIPEEDMTKVTNSGYVSRMGNYVRFYDRIDSPLLKEYEDSESRDPQPGEEYEDSESRDPQPGEEWEYDDDDDGSKCVIVKKIKGWPASYCSDSYDVILSDIGEYENFTREELIRPTGRTYPRIIEAIKEYLDEANN